MDRFGYARTVEPSVYERNQEAADKENKYVFRCMSSGKICIFTDRGTMHTVRVKDLPFGKFRDKGTPVDNLCNYSSAEEEIVSVTPLADILDKKLVFVTSAGMVKVVDGGEFNASKRTISATRLSVEEDRLVMASPADQGEFLVMQTVDGYFIRFAVSEIPEKKKTAVGVRGIRLGADDRVEKAWLIASRMEFAVSYKEKKLILNKIRLSKRDGKGTKVRV